MYYICKKRVKYADVQYGIMDTNDGVVEYYSPKDVIAFVKRGIKVDGVTYTNGKYIIKVLKPMQFEVVESDDIVSESPNKTLSTPTDKLCSYLEQRSKQDNTFNHSFGVIKSKSDDLKWFKQNDLSGNLKMLRNIDSIMPNWNSYTLCFRFGYDCEIYTNILSNKRVEVDKENFGVLYITVCKDSKNFRIDFHDFGSPSGHLSKVSFELRSIEELLSDLSYHLLSNPLSRIVYSIDKWLYLYELQGEDVVFKLMNDTMLRLTDLLSDTMGVDVDVINACMLDGFDCVGFDNIDVSHLFDGCSCSIYSAVEGTPRNISTESFGLDIMRGGDIRFHYDGSIDDFNGLKEWLNNLLNKSNTSERVITEESKEFKEFYELCKLADKVFKKFYRGTSIEEYISPLNDIVITSDLDDSFNLMKKSLKLGFKLSYNKEYEMSKFLVSMIKAGSDSGYLNLDKNQDKYILWVANVFTSDLLLDSLSTSNVLVEGSYTDVSSWLHNLEDELKN